MYQIVLVLLFGLSLTLQASELSASEMAVSELSPSELNPSELSPAAQGATQLTSAQQKIARAEYPTETLYQLWLAQQQDPTAALRFYQKLAQKHQVELDPADPSKARVTYFAKGSADTDYLLQSGGPDFYGLRFQQIGNSPIYFCIQHIPADAWFNYGINEFKRTPSPTVPGLWQNRMAHIADGSVIGPKAPLSPYIHHNPATPQGQLTEQVVSSAIMAEERRITVYQPAADPASIRHKLVVQFDGQNYARGPAAGPDWEGWTPMPTILDNLIAAEKIAPTIVIFVHNQGNRSGDLISSNMADFVGLELIPWARKHYRISADAADVVVSGASRGGFAAAHTALRHPAIVGGVLSQSGSFYYTLQPTENWPIYPEFDGKLLLDYQRSAKFKLRFYLDVGLYDLGLAAVGTNRQFRDILLLKGYQVDYVQYNGGHAHLGWRHTLANGLLVLLGRRPNEPRPNEPQPNEPQLTENTASKHPAR